MRNIDTYQKELIGQLSGEFIMMSNWFTKMVISLDLKVGHNCTHLVNRFKALISPILNNTTYMSTRLKSNVN